MREPMWDETISKYGYEEDEENVVLTKTQAVKILGALTYFMDYVQYGPEENSDSLDHHIENSVKMSKLLRELV